MGDFSLKGILKTEAPNCIKRQTLESYWNRVIAVDAIINTGHYHVIGGRTPLAFEKLTNKAGDSTGHLQVLFSRTVQLLKAGIKPVYVFDGELPNLKKQVDSKSFLHGIDNEKKKSGKSNEELIEQSVKVTRQNIDDCKNLLGLMGVPVVEAPSEAVAQCTALCKSGEVYAVLATEMYSLTFGAPRVLLYPSQLTSTTPVLELEVAKVLEELKLSMDQLIDLCILSGCDYCDINEHNRFPRLGTSIALNLIREHGSIEKVLENINKDRYNLPDGLPYQEARILFKEPQVLPENVVSELKWSAPDEEGLVNFLVKKNDFDLDIVTKAIEEINAAKSKPTQGRFESFSKTGASDFVPIKRKVAVGEGEFGQENLMSWTFTLR